VTQPVTKDYRILPLRSDLHLLILLPDLSFGLKLSMLDVCLRWFFSYISQNCSMISTIKSREKRHC